VTVAPSIWFTSMVTAARPSASMGWRTVVSGGSVQFMKAESSKPTTDTSRGTARPARRAARIAPSASGSLPQMTPVTPCRSIRVAAACPPSSANMACSTASW
jgi:hypothetical protein